MTLMQLIKTVLDDLYNRIHIQCDEGLGVTETPYLEQVGCVAKTYRDAERCVVASSTHPTGSRPSPAGARPGSTLPLN